MAIAFDATASTGTASSGAGFGYAHVCTGSNRFLSVFIQGDNAVDRVSGVTYNGVAMVRYTAFAFGALSFFYIYTLQNPSSGSNTVQITTTQDRLFNVVSISHTGVSQMENQANNTGTANTLTASLTTGVDNAWLVLGNGTEQSAAQTAGASTTVRVNKTGFAAGQVGILDSNAAKTPAGSYSLISNWGSSVGYGYAILSLQPQVSLTLALAQGSFTLTGLALGLFRAHIMALAQGAFTFTGNAINFVLTMKWNNSTEHTSAMTNGTLHNSSWVDQTEHTSSMNNQTKN